MKQKTWGKYIPPIRTSYAVYEEIITALMTAVSGHAPNPISPRAKRVYRKWMKAEFKPALVPFPEKKVRK